MRVHFLCNFTLCALLTACSVGPSRSAEQQQSNYEDGSIDRPTPDASKDAPLNTRRDAEIDACAGAQEACNGLDDDCDGKTDEGNLDPGDDCNSGMAGICAAGQERCIDGKVQCMPEQTSTDETCNGLDDDCDGTVDDGNLDPGGDCETGTSGICAAGRERCVDGKVQCVPEQTSTDETCNGLDDDCDGKTDEGNLDPGDACASGELGVCSAGTRKCVSGKLTCVANTSASQEKCNGLDDDCDGSKDEGNPGAGASCDTGKKGVCAAGTTACSGGQVACTQNKQAASEETCDNGLDDDCDGLVDDGCCEPGTLDCNSAGGCECIGTACCGTGCQSAHMNGVGDYFFDCEPLGTHTLTQAAAACLAHTGDISNCFNHGAACDSGTTSAVCSSGDTECACWTYSGTNPGRVFLNAGSTSCLCPLSDDPIWN